MTRNDQQMYSNINSIAKSLEKIANTLDNNVPQTTKDIPGFEGTLDALDVLTDIKTITDDYSSTRKVILEQQALKLEPQLQLLYRKIAALDESRAAAASSKVTTHPTWIPNFSSTHINGIKNDSDHDIRIAAKLYEKLLWNDGSENGKKLHTKKDCILDYVTKEFGVFGARYTDIIKFAYYLGAHNDPKFTNANRGYYSCAFNVRLNGHLIMGGKDQLVKGINLDGKERYFALSYVDNATDYYKKIS
tara:strand:- start:53 stop:793 length:741 start_codon:yes stop_codon:yes gene_type:complete